MKKFIYLTFLLISFFSFSQKKELRNAQKLMNQSFYSETLDVLSQIEDHPPIRIASEYEQVLRHLDVPMPYVSSRAHGLDFVVSKCYSGFGRSEQLFGLG